MKVGNAAFHFHVDFHSKESNKQTSSLISVSKVQKENIIRVVAKVVYLDVQPMSFCYGKEELLHFAQYTIELGQSYYFPSNINVQKLVPCIKAV